MRWFVTDTLLWSVACLHLAFCPVRGSAISFENEEPLWVQIVRASNGVSTACTHLGSYALADPAEFPLACQSKAMLLGADTFHVDTARTTCDLKRCSTWNDMRFTADIGGRDVYTHIVGPWQQLIRAEDGYGTECEYLGSYVAQSFQGDPMECFAQAAIQGADTVDFRPTNSKCYFKRCGTFADIAYTPNYGAQSSYSILAKEWSQMTRQEERMHVDCAAVGTVSVVDIADAPSICQSQATLNGADVFEILPGTQQCVMRRCNNFASIKFLEAPGNAAGADSYTRLTGSQWVQLAQTAAGMASICEAVGSTKVQPFSGFPSGCSSRAMVLGADTFNARIDGNDMLCDFQKCGAFQDISYTADNGGHSIFTRLVPGWTRLVRAEDGMGSECPYLGSYVVTNLTEFPEVCYTLAALRNADTFDFRPANSKCYFKRCSNFDEILYTDAYGAQDVYTLLFPRGEEGWGPCEPPACSELHLFYTAELRGRYTPVAPGGLPCDPDDSGGCAGGHARRKTYMQQKRAEFPNSTVFIEMGGGSFGPPFDGHPDYPQGAPAAELTNMLDYDMCLFSQSDLLTSASRSGSMEEFARSYSNRTCPWLMSNIELQPPFEQLNRNSEPFKVQTLPGGFKVGFVSMYPHSDAYGFAYGPEVIRLDPRSQLQSIYKGEAGRVRLDPSRIQEQLELQRGAWGKFDDYLSDVYVLSTQTPNDVLAAAEALRAAHPDVKALVLLVSKAYRPDQVYWLMKYGPFDILLVSNLDDAFTFVGAPAEEATAIQAEGSGKTKVIAGSYTWSGFGHLRVRFDETAAITKFDFSKSVQLDPVTPADPAVQARLSELYARTRERRAQAFGQLTNPLTGGHRLLETSPSMRQCYYTDCPAGDHLGRAALWKARSKGHRAQVSFLNLGGFRQVLQQGEVGIVDCENTHAFKNQLGLYKVSGNDLYLNLQIFITTLGERGFAGAGVRVAMHEPCWDFVNHTVYAFPEGPPGSPAEIAACRDSGIQDVSIRIINIEVYQMDFEAEACSTNYNNCPGQWVPLEKSSEYTLVTTDYVASEFQGTTFTEVSLGTDAEGLCDYIAGNTPVQVDPWTAYRDRGNIQYASPEDGWAAGNRIPSVAGNISIIENSPMCPSGHFLNTAEKRCDPCLAGTRSISDPARDRCEKCPSGFFGDQIGQSACLACDPGFYGKEEGLTACRECPPAQYSELGSASCVGCPKGTFGDEAGLGTCKSCDAGSYGPQPGQTECRSCEPGTYSNLGAQHCLDCPVGLFGNESGRSSCDVCSLGTFSSQPASTSCTWCSWNRSTPLLWTTMRVQVINGRKEYVYLEGAEDSSFCGCDRGTWQSEDGNACYACGEGLSCPGLGNVFVLAGYSAEKAYDVHRCFVEEKRCPGGSLGECQEGRQGVACSECEARKIPAEDGKCKDCKQSSYIPFVGACIALMAFLLLIYIKVDNENATKQSRSFVVLAISAQQLVLVFQMLTIIAQMSIQWHEPIKSIFIIMQLLMVDLELVNVNCVGRVPPLVMYVGRLLAIVIVLVIVTLYHFLFVLFKHGGRFRERMASLRGVIGTVVLMFYISIIGTILLSLQCNKNPNGEWTVHAYPSITCFEKEKHLPMVTVAITALVFPMGFLAHCLYVIIVAPKRIRQLDVRFMQQNNFLFFRFTLEARWYAIVFLLRNALIACAPIVTNQAWQVLALQFIMMSSIIVTCRFLPWRVMPANVIDIITSVVVNMMLTLVALKTDDLQGAVVSALATLGFALVVLAVLIVWVLSVYGYLIRMRKKYQFFLCHHKAHAGSMARLLKMMLSDILTRKVFVDSDDLAHLDSLFDQVRCHTETLVVLCTTEILGRPWCVGEITVAHINKVKATLLMYPDFMLPSDVWLAQVTQHVSFETLTSHALTETMVRSALLAMRNVSSIPMPSMPTYQRLDRLIDTLLAGKAEHRAKASCRGQQQSTESSRVCVGADVSDIEALASARILSKLTLALCQHQPELMPLLLVDFDPTGTGQCPLPHVTKVFCLLCTGRCFGQLNFIGMLLDAMELGCQSIPIVTGDAFRFPTPSFYKELHGNVEVLLNTVGGKRDARVLVNYVKAIFKTIAANFTPNSTLSLLQAQAQEIFHKISGTYFGKDSADGSPTVKGILSKTATASDEASDMTPPPDTHTPFAGASEKDGVVCDAAEAQRDAPHSNVGSTEAMEEDCCSEASSWKSEDLANGLVSHKTLGVSTYI